MRPPRGPRRQRKQEAPLAPGPRRRRCGHLSPRAPACLLPSQPRPPRVGDAPRAASRGRGASPPAEPASVPGQREEPGSGALCLPLGTQAQGAPFPSRLGRAGGVMTHARRAPAAGRQRQRETRRHGSGPVPPPREDSRDAPLAGSATAHARGCAAPRAGPAHISRERNGRVSRALLRESRRKRLRRGPGAVCVVRVPAPVGHGVSRGRGRGRLSRARPRTCPSALFPSGAARPDQAVPPLAESSTAPPARAQRVATCGRPRARGLRFWGLSLGHPAHHPGRLHCGSVAMWTPRIRCGRCSVHCWVSRCAPSQQP